MLARTFVPADEFGERLPAGQYNLIVRQEHFDSGLQTGLLQPGQQRLASAAHLGVGVGLPLPHRFLGGLAQRARSCRVARSRTPNESAPSRRTRAAVSTTGDATAPRLAAKHNNSSRASVFMVGHPGGSLLRFVAFLAQPHRLALDHGAAVGLELAELAQGVAARGPQVHRREGHDDEQQNENDDIRAAP